MHKVLHATGRWGSGHCVPPKKTIGEEKDAFFCIPGSSLDDFVAYKIQGVWISWSEYHLVAPADQLSQLNNSQVLKMTCAASGHFTLPLYVLCILCQTVPTIMHQSTQSMAAQLGPPARHLLHHRNIIGALILQQHNSCGNSMLNPIPEGRNSFLLGLFQKLSSGGWAANTFLFCGWRVFCWQCVRGVGGGEVTCPGGQGVFDP